MRPLSVVTARLGRMMRRIEVGERRARLAARHHLLARTRTDDLPRLANDLVAFHSTDPVTVYLSAMARMRNPSIARSSRPSTRSAA